MTKQEQRGNTKQRVFTMHRTWLHSWGICKIINILTTTIPSFNHGIQYIVCIYILTEHKNEIFISLGCIVMRMKIFQKSFFTEKF